MRNRVTLKFTPSHMKYFLVEKWEALKLPYVTIIQEAFKNTRLLPLYLPDKVTNRQACLTATQTSKGKKYDEIEFAPS